MSGFRGANGGPGTGGPAISPLMLHDHGKGSASITLDAGTPVTAAVDDVIAELGHEPNGYFWEGVARRVAPDLADRLDTDPEAGMFSAYGTDPDALVDLATRLALLAREPDRMRALVVAADADGFDFDD